MAEGLYHFKVVEEEANHSLCDAFSSSVGLTVALISYGLFPSAKSAHSNISGPK